MYSNLNSSRIRLIIIPLITLLLILLAFVVYSITKLNTKVDNLIISNTTANSATIVWTTDKEIETKVSVQDQKGKYYDDRDVELNGEGEYKLSKNKKRFTHHVTVRNLSPETKYKFKINNGLFTLKSDIDDFETTKALDIIETPDPIYGQIFDSNNQVITDGLVQIKARNINNLYSEIRTATISNSSYSLDISLLKDSSNNNLFPKDEYTQELTVLFFNKEGEIKLSKSDISPEKDQPVDRIDFVDSNLEMSYTNPLNNLSLVSYAIELEGECEPGTYDIGGCECDYTNEKRVRSVRRCSNNGIWGSAYNEEHSSCGTFRLQCERASTPTPTPQNNQSQQCHISEIWDCYDRNNQLHTVSSCEDKATWQANGGYQAWYRQAGCTSDTPDNPFGCAGDTCVYGERCGTETSSWCNCGPNQSTIEYKIPPGGRCERKTAKEIRMEEDPGITPRAGVTNRTSENPSTDSESDDENQVCDGSRVPVERNSLDLGQKCEDPFEKGGDMYCCSVREIGTSNIDEDEQLEQEDDAIFFDPLKESEDIRAERMCGNRLLNDCSICTPDEKVMYICTAQNEYDNNPLLTGVEEDVIDTIRAEYNEFCTNNPNDYLCADEIDPLTVIAYMADIMGIEHGDGILTESRIYSFLANNGECPDEECEQYIASLTSNNGFGICQTVDEYRDKAETLPNPLTNMQMCFEVLSDKTMPRRPEIGGTLSSVEFWCNERLKNPNLAQNDATIRRICIENIDLFANEETSTLALCTDNPDTDDVDEAASEDCMTVGLASFAMYNGNTAACEGYRESDLHAERCEEYGSEMMATFYANQAISDTNDLPYSALASSEIPVTLASEVVNRSIVYVEVIQGMNRNQIQELIDAEYAKYDEDSVSVVARYSDDYYTTPEKIAKINQGFELQGVDPNADVARSYVLNHTACPPNGCIENSTVYGVNNYLASTTNATYYDNEVEGQKCANYTIDMDGTAHNIINNDVSCPNTGDASFYNNTVVFESVCTAQATFNGSNSLINTGETLNTNCTYDQYLTNAALIKADAEANGGTCDGVEVKGSFSTGGKADPSPEMMDCVCEILVMNGCEVTCGYTGNEFEGPGCPYHNNVAGEDGEDPNAMRQIQDLFMSKVNAQTNSQPEGFEESGVYFIQSNDYIIRKNYVYIEDTNELKFFIDTNRNGRRDEGEQDANNINVKLKKVDDNLVYNLTNGWNLIHIPLVGDKFKTASALLKEFNSQGANMTHVTTYRSGKFLVYSEREGSEGEILTYGNDFNILPGEGYFVRNHTVNTRVTLNGNKVEGSLELLVEPGWNLVGFYSENKSSYQGFDLLRQMNTNNIEADILSSWTNGMYTNLVLEDGVEYGADYKVFPTNGYWIRSNNTQSINFRPE